MTARTARPRHVLLAVALATAGCSRPAPRVTAEGAVSVRGQPLTAGLVRLVRTDGGAVGSGVIRPDGTFAVTDLIPGEYRACLVEGPPPGSGSSWGGPGGGPAAAPPKPVAVPDKYKDVTTSGLVFPIGPDRTRADINIE